MKNILYILVASLILFSSCDKSEDPIFDKSPEERLSAVLSKYKARLIEDEGYWIAYYSGNAILMKFNEDNTVEFKSTYNNGTDDRTVTYRVGSSQVPELIFESHTVFHAIYEDNLSTGEYEFVFDDLWVDKIQFISKTDLGETKTKLSFYKSTVDELEKVVAVKEKIELLSVFKSVVLSEKPDYTGALTLNSDGTATLTSRIGDIVSKTEYRFDITSNGLLFDPALSVGDDLLVSEFVFDEATNSFQAVEEESVTIEEKMVPVLPLAPYTFGEEDNAVYNYLDGEKSSKAYLNYYSDYVRDMSIIGLEISGWSLSWLNTDGAVPYVYINTNMGNIWYDFNYEIKNDDKVYFTPTGDTNAGGLDSYLQPLLQLLFNSGGHFIEDSGNLSGYTNGTFSLINADDPAYKINFYVF